MIIGKVAKCKLLQSPQEERFMAIVFPKTKLLISKKITSQKKPQTN